VKRRIAVLGSSVFIASMLALQPSLAAAADAPPGDDGASCRANWFAFEGCRDRAWTGPLLELGVGVGVSMLNRGGPFGFGKGVGSATNPGPAWSILAGVEVLPWLAVEARYLGMYDAANASVGGSGGYLASAGTAVVRLTAPLQYVRPYLFGGIGYYNFGFSGGAAGSPLLSTSQPGVPLGVGVDVPLSYHFSIGAEASYHFQLNETFSQSTTNGIDGGDDTRFDLVVRGRL
jgi:hypothetical protein